jgi:YHS domain-containing protein
MNVQKAKAAGTAEHRDRTHSFRCEMCWKKFVEAPEKYASQD